MKKTKLKGTYVVELLGEMIKISTLEHGVTFLRRDLKPTLICAKKGSDPKKDCERRYYTNISFVSNEHINDGIFIEVENLDEASRLANDLSDIFYGGIE